MKYIFYSLLFCSNFLHAMKSTLQSFEKTPVAQKINTIKTKLINIKKQVDIGCKKKNILLLKKQLNILPPIRKFKTLYQYSDGMQKNPLDFIAQISVDLDFIKKDIHSCIQFIQTNDTRLDLFRHNILLMLNSIIESIEEQKKRECEGFKKHATKETATDFLYDEIMTQKVRAFFKKRRGLLKRNLYDKKKSTSFSILPNPFEELESEKAVDEAH